MNRTAIGIYGVLLLGLGILTIRSMISKKNPVLTSPTNEVDLGPQIFLPAVSTTNVSDVLYKHYEHPSLAQLTAAQEYVNQTAGYFNSWSNQLAIIDNQRIAIESEPGLDSTSKETLLTEIKWRRQATVANLTEAWKSLNETDRTFMRSKGFDDSVLNDLTENIKLPWEEQ